MKAGLQLRLAQHLTLTPQLQQSIRLLQLSTLELQQEIETALAEDPQVAIVRGSLSEPKIAVVDFKAIVTGHAPDVRLEARDVVYVPFSPYRTLERYAKLITDTFVRTVAANEGGRAVDSKYGGVGVSNPINP